MVSGAGVELDAGQQHRVLDVLQVVGLGHDVLAREVAVALLQDLVHDHGGHVAVGVVEVVRVAFREPLRHEGLVGLDPRIVGQSGVARVFGVDRAQHTGGTLDARGDQRALDRGDPGGDVVVALEAHLAGLADRHGAELARDAGDQRIHRQADGTVCSG